MVAHWLKPEFTIGDWLRFYSNFALSQWYTMLTNDFVGRILDTWTECTRTSHQASDARDRCIWQEEPVARSFAAHFAFLSAILVLSWCYGRSFRRVDLRLLLADLPVQRLAASIVTYGAALNACERAEQWMQVKSCAGKGVVMCFVEDSWGFCVFELRLLLLHLFLAKIVSMSLSACLSSWWGHASLIHILMLFVAARHCCS